MLFVNNQNTAPGAEKGTLAMKNITIHRLYPLVGERFDLGLNGDYGNYQPLDMVRRTGHDSRGWVHKGHMCTGRDIRPFKLIEIATHGTFDEVMNELSRHGRVPEGQWICGFKVAYPTPDGRRNVAIADATWVGPDGMTYFPYVSRAGDIRFHRSNGNFGGDCWLWIVGV